MPRKIIKKFLPEHRTLLESRLLRPFRAAFHDPALVAPHRRSVVRGLAIGLFWGMIPLPGHSLFAAAMAVGLRVNVVVAIAATWITNPFTAVPIVLTEHWFGTLLLGAAPLPPAVASEAAAPFSLAALAELWHRVVELGTPVLVGAVALGLAAAALGYLGLNWLWLISVRRQFARRRQQPRTTPPG